MPSTPQAEPAVLLVGAGEAMQAALAQALDRHGVFVDTAAANAVVDAVVAAAPDLILLVGDAARDCGSEVLAELAASPLSSVVPVAILDDNAALDARLKAFRHGAAAIIPYSASADAIADQVARLAREIPERGGGSLGNIESTLEDLITTLGRELRSGVLSVRGEQESEADAVRLVLGGGQPLTEMIDEFVSRLQGHVVLAEPLRYEFDERAGGTVQLLGADSSAPSKFTDVSGVRILLADDDAARADAVAQQLRSSNATVVVTDLDPTAMRFERLRQVDPTVLLIGEEQLQGAGYDLVRRMRRDTRLRWASLLVVRWNEVWGDNANVPAVHRLLGTLNDLAEPERAVSERANLGGPFDTRLEAMGPTRLLRALTNTSHPVRLTVFNPRVQVKLEISNELIVSASTHILGKRLEQLEGAAALSAFVVLGSGRAHVESVAQPTSTNLMAPIDVALDMADAEPPPIPPSLPSPAGESVRPPIAGALAHGTVRPPSAAVPAQPAPAPAPPLIEPAPPSVSFPATMPAPESAGMPPSVPMPASVPAPPGMPAGMPAPPGMPAGMPAPASVPVPVGMPAGMPAPPSVPAPPGMPAGMPAPPGSAVSPSVAPTSSPPISVDADLISLPPSGPPPAPAAAFDEAGDLDVIPLQKRGFLGWLIPLAVVGTAAVLALLFWLSPRMRAMVFGSATPAKSATHATPPPKATTEPAKSAAVPPAKSAEPPSSATAASSAAPAKSAAAPAKSAQVAADSHGKIAVGPHPRLPVIHHARAPTCRQLLAKERLGHPAKPKAAAYRALREARRGLVRGDLDAAERAYCRATRLDKSSVAAVVELSRVFLIRHDGHAAARWAVRAGKRGADDATVKGLLGDAYALLGEFKKARIAWLEANGGQPGDPRAEASLARKSLVIARAALGVRAYLRAERYFRRAIVLAPDHASGAIGLSHALILLDVPADAMIWVRYALALAPKSAAAEIALGDVLHREGKHIEARRAWEKALKLSPGNAAAEARLKH